MLMDRMGASGALVKMEGFPSGGNSTLVYFSCADCAIESDVELKFIKLAVHQIYCLPTAIAFDLKYRHPIDV